MQAVGIDIGTTSICGVVTEIGKAGTLKSVTENSNAFIETENNWEKIQSVDVIMEKALRIADDLICNETAVIGITGQMHGIVYYDKNGCAVSPLYTWQDMRGSLPYKDTTYADFLKSCPGYGNVTDFYNRINRLVPKEAVGFCTIHDYLVMKLCGLKSAIVHDSNAASFGCFDVSVGKFTVECGIKPVSGFSIAGSYRGIPVGVAIGDNQASVFSTLADEKNVLINIGTGSQVSVVTDRPVICDEFEIRPYFDGKFLSVGAALCGGRAYSLLKEFFCNVLDITDENIVYKKMAEFIEADGQSLKVDTRFAGTRKDNSITGSITGITTENFTPSALTKGVLSGMIDELYGMYEFMNTKTIGIVGSGNGIRKNPALVKVSENKFGGKMKIPVHTEEAAFGAALYGAVAAGLYDNAAEAQKFIEYMK